MTQPRKKIVLGLGNLLFSDEGFGIHALKSVQKRCGSRYPVDWVDGGVLGLNLLPFVEDSSHLLVLDAVDAGKPGGTLVELKQGEVPLYNGVKMSEHQVGFQEVLALARLRGNYPEILHLIGVQPADMSAGLGLSEEVKAVMPEVIRRAEIILEEWLRA